MTAEEASDAGFAQVDDRVFMRFRRDGSKEFISIDNDGEAAPWPPAPESFPAYDPVLPVDTFNPTAQTPEIQPAAAPAPINSSPMTFDQALQQFPGLYEESDRDQFNQAQAQQQAINTIFNNAPAPLSPQAAAALAIVASLPQGAQDLFDLGGTGYGSANSIAQNLTPTLPEPGVAMPAAASGAAQSMPPIVTTSAAAQAYAISRPDLVNNWNFAFAPGNEANETAQWIRSFGTFQSYLEQDNGAPFPADAAPAAAQSLSAMPPLVTTSAAAQAYADSRPDLVNNWRNAFSPAFANDITAQYIRQFPTFEAYLENDHGGPFAGAPAAPGAVLPAAHPGANGVNLPPGGVSPLFNPTHILVGYTREGYEVYRQTDEGGRLEEYYDIPGHGATGIHYLSGPNDPTSYVYSTARPGGSNAGGGGPLTTTGAKSSSMGLVVLIGFGAVAVYLATRDKRS